MPQTPAELAAAEKKASGKKLRKTSKFQNRLAVLPCHIRTVREELGLSINEVSKATKISISTLSLVERGSDVCMSTVQTLCRYYGMRVEALWPLPFGSPIENIKANP